MTHRTIQHPTTGRSLRVRAWQIVPVDVFAALKAGEIRSAKDLSWRLLNEPESVEDMVEEQDGDAAESNFALGVFEHALDWTLGLAVLNFMRAVAARGKRPKPFCVAADRRGRVYLILASGRVLEVR